MKLDKHFHSSQWNASGVDGVPTNIWQATEESVKALIKLCQQICRMTQWPSKTLICIPTPTKEI